LDSTIFLFLVQDGVINGAIYALAAIALVLVFAVTRVILVPQGEFIAFGAMTVAAFEAGRTLAIALIVPMGPMLYRVAFAPMAQASVLVLLIAAFGVHFSLMGLGLVFFGAEGVATQPLISRDFSLGDIPVTGQSVAVVATTVVLLVVFALFFERTLLGKALRACSSNRLGARLVGVPTALAGEIAFAPAAAMGAGAGVLAGPIIPPFYDSGFLIGLKAFVAAILGGRVSLPLRARASGRAGLPRAVLAVSASNFKEVLVFGLILPVLLWRSLRAPAHAEDE